MSPTSTTQATSPNQIRQHLDAALGSDGRAAVVAVRQLLAADLPWLEERAVRLARADGYTWAQLGRLLHRSRQAVRQRFRSIDATTQELTFTPMTVEQRVVGVIGRSYAASRRRSEFEGAQPGDVVAW